jgi:cytochrome c-type biogenesis protein CcmF
MPCCRPGRCWPGSAATLGWSSAACGWPWPLAAILGLVAFAVVAPRSALASAGLVVGFWLIGGALLELAERVKAFRAPWAEVRRRLTRPAARRLGHDPGHAGLGIFVLGASFETTWRVEAAQALSVGGQLKLGAYELALSDVGTVEGSNYIAERGIVKITKAGVPVCEAKPERRFYPTASRPRRRWRSAPRVLDDLYVVLGERRAGQGGQPAWLVRAFVNPWVRLIFLGPLVMAIGGLVSLSDRRLRFGVGKRAERAA